MPSDPTPGSPVLACARLALALLVGDDLCRPFQECRLLLDVEDLRDGLGLLAVPTLDRRLRLVLERHVDVSVFFSTSFSCLEQVFFIVEQVLQVFVF